MKSDIEIARETKLLPIEDIAEMAGLQREDIESYGRHKAKVDPKILHQDRQMGKLILVTAITPTPAGEGKTTTTIGLADALRRIGKKAVAALREPSLGPVFGIKGGAAGGGYAQIVPMEDINLHFTGDFHAIGAANNLLAAMLDNHIFQGNRLNIDPKRITWKRCVDMNDRQLRGIVDGLGGRFNGTPREDGYDITVACEVMATLCLANSIADLRERLGRHIVAYTYDDQPVTAADLKAHGAMTALLKDAIKPNLVQTLEHTPVFVHGGPFANIAHGCNSVLATRLAMQTGDYAITEAGFGADLGAEKFFDIKCRLSGLTPSAVVLVATIRALKMHGGVPKNALDAENLVSLALGLPNLIQHIDNMKNVYGLPVIVAINRFPTDTEKELELVKQCCLETGTQTAFSEVFTKGGAGAIDLAEKTAALCEQQPHFQLCYDDDLSIAQKIEAVARRIYHADGVDITAGAQTQIQKLTAMGFGSLPVCLAKTQYSFSDNPKLLGAPKGFHVGVRNVKVNAGAGFLVALTGDIMTMPGLPRQPAAEAIDVNADGEITGLF